MSGNAQTKIIAHRGFSSQAPENTRASFEKAIKSGADYIELDVHKTRDDSLVVIHDKSLKRTSCNGSDALVEDLSYSQLMEISVGYCQKFHDKFLKEKVPLLRDILEMANNRIRVCIEIKVQGIEDQVLALVNDLKMKDEVIFFSFHYPVLAKIRHLDKNIPILYLVNSVNANSFDYASLINVNAIGAGYSTKIDKDLIELAHNHNIDLWKWTVNEKDEMEHLIEVGIDGIITNYPDMAIEITQNRK